MLGHRKIPNSNNLGNVEESQRLNEISTNYIDSGESFNRKTTIVDINFASKISSGLQPDPEPKTMAECISARTGSNVRKQSRQNCTRSRKERYSDRLYLLETFCLWDQNGFSFIKEMKQ